MDHGKRRHFAAALIVSAIVAIAISPVVGQGMTPAAQPIPTATPSPAYPPIFFPGGVPRGFHRDATARTGFTTLRELSPEEDVPPSTDDRRRLVDNVPNAVGEIAEYSAAVRPPLGPTWNWPQSAPQFVGYYRKHVPTTLTADERRWIVDFRLHAPEAEWLTFANDRSSDSPTYGVGTGCDPQDCAGHRFVVAYDDEMYHFYAAYREHGIWHGFGDGSFRAKMVALIVLGRNVVDPMLRFPLDDDGTTAVADAIRCFPLALMGPEQEPGNPIPLPEHSIVP